MKTVVTPNIIRRYENVKALSSDTKQNMITTLPELNVRNEEPLINTILVLDIKIENHGVAISAMRLAFKE